MDIKHKDTEKTLLTVEGDNLRDADLTGADLEGANLQGAKLEGADLSDADLEDADLSGANLRDAKLRGVDLTGADLRGANLAGAKMQGADLEGADMEGVNLLGADTEGAKLPSPIVHINGLLWDIVIFAGFIIIGCQHHKTADWQDFDDAAIEDMDDHAGHALLFWQEHKAMIMEKAASIEEAGA